MKIKIYQLVLMSFTIFACLNQEIVLPTQTAILPTPKTYPTPLPETWIGDAGLVSGQPCLAPCFFGIFAGETPIEQTLILLQKSGIEFCAFKNKTDVLCDNIVIYADSESYLVSIIGYSSDYFIPLKDIVATYGEPNYIDVIPTGIPEFPKVTIYIVFSDLRMALILEEMDLKAEGAMVTESSMPETIVYYDDLRYKKDIENSPYLQAWKGYGLYIP